MRDYDEVRDDVENGAGSVDVEETGLFVDCDEDECEKYVQELEQERENEYLERDVRTVEAFAEPGKKFRRGDDEYYRECQNDSPNHHWH